MAGMARALFCSSIAEEMLYIKEVEKSKEAITPQPAEAEHRFFGASDKIFARHNRSSEDDWGL